MFSFKSPAILLLSYPRSGSSWIGKLLATSNRVVYLREPITRQCVKRTGYTLVKIGNDLTIDSIYKSHGDKAFHHSALSIGKPLNPFSDAFIFTRRKKRKLIKEVNPKAVKFYCDRYNPIVILLLRHPAAVASSFSRLGWLKSRDVQKEKSNLKC